MAGIQVLVVFHIQVHLHGVMIHRVLFFPTGLVPIIQRWLRNVAPMKADIRSGFRTRQNMMAHAHYLQHIMMGLEQVKQAGRRLWAIVIIKIFQDGIMVLLRVDALQTRIIYPSLHLKWFYIQAG